MTRKTISFNLADAAGTAATSVHHLGTREAWIGGGSSGERDAPRTARAPSVTAMPSNPAPAPFLPGMIAACCLTLARGAEEIGRVWSEAPSETARRSTDGARRMMLCWTPLDAARLQHDLGCESLGSAFALAARTASVAERVSREAAGLSGR